MYNEIILGDCLKVLRDIPDNSINLICTDPPYFKVKSQWWDNQWDNPKEFLKWLDSISEQWHRILKPNGSLYCFASSAMSARVEVMLSERFNILNHIVWDKRNRSRAAQTCKEQSRKFFPESERIIFCEHYGSDNIAKGDAGYSAKCDELRGFVFEPLRAWFRQEKHRAGITNGEINKMLGVAITGGGMASHYFSISQWELPVFEYYTKLQQAFPGYFTRDYEDLKQEYEDLRQEYEDLRQEYEDLRRTFNVTPHVPYTDVWHFPTIQSYDGKHPCEKPSSMLDHIIKASSKPGDVVLDCFAGSGATLYSAKKLSRHFIGIEIDPHWVSHIVANIKRVERVETHNEVKTYAKVKKTSKQLSLFPEFN